MGNQPSGSQRCQECGAPLGEGCKFCQECGARVQPPAQPAGSAGVHFGGDVGMFRGDIDQSTHQTTNIGVQHNYSGPVQIQQGPQPPSAQDFFEQGLNSLRCQMYPQAVASFRQAAGAGLSGAELLYYTALAQLNGKRPRAQTFSTIQTILKTLKSAVEQQPGLRRAWLLWALVIEDYYVLNRMPEPTPGVAHLLRQVGSIQLAEAQELRQHTNAPGNRIWEQLA